MSMKSEIKLKRTKRIEARSSKCYSPQNDRHFKHIHIIFKTHNIFLSRHNMRISAKEMFNVNLYSLNYGLRDHCLHSESREFFGLLSDVEKIRTQVTF